MREKNENPTQDRVQMLAAQSAADEPYAFVELLGVFHPYIAVTAHTFALPADEFDDLCDHGRTALYKAVRTYQDGRGASFTTYARVCIRNEMTSYVRSLAKLHRHEGYGVSLDDAGSEALADESTIPEDMVLASEFMTELMRVIREELSESERTVIGHRISGLGTAEIAVLLGKSTKSIENTLFRARQKIKNRLK